MTVTLIPEFLALYTLAHCSGMKLLLYLLLTSLPFTQRKVSFILKKTSITKTKRLINTDGEKCLFKLENVIY